MSRIGLIITSTLILIAQSVLGAAPRNVLYRASQFVELGEFEEAFAVLAPYADERPVDPATAELLLAIYESTKDWSAQINLLENWVEDGASDWRLLGRLALARFRIADETGAEEALETMIDIQPDDMDIWRYAVSIVSSVGRLDRAVGLYEEGRVRLGGAATFSEELANLHESRGDYSRAVDEYRRIVLAFPEAVRGIGVRVLSLADVPGAAPEVDGALKRWVRDKPDDSVPVRLRGDLALMQRRMDDAWELYRRADALSGGSGADLLGFAGTAAGEGFYDEVENATHYIIEHHTDSSVRESARWLLSEALLARGRTTRVLAHLDTIATGGGARAGRAWYAIGEVQLFHVEDVEAAERAFAIADTFPDLDLRASAKWGMVRAALWRGDVSAASTMIEAAMRIRAKGEAGEKILFAYADLLLLDGKRDEARGAYARFAASFPASDWANDALGRAMVIDFFSDDSLASVAYINALFLSYGPDRLDAGRAFVEVAERASGTTLEGQALWDASAVLLEEGRMHEAVELYERISVLDPSSFWSPFALLRLGDIQAEHFNDPGLARSTWERILVDFPESIAASEARRRLERFEPPSPL